MPEGRLLGTDAQHVAKQKLETLHERARQTFSPVVLQNVPHVPPLQKRLPELDRDRNVTYWATVLTRRLASDDELRAQYPHQGEAMVARKELRTEVMWVQIPRDTASDRAKIGWPYRQEVEWTQAMFGLVDGEPKDSAAIAGETGNRENIKEGVRRFIRRIRKEVGITENVDPVVLPEEQPPPEK